MQADTIIPQPGNVQAWDRYAYALNNPLNSIDPSGHCACLVIIGGVLIGGAVIVAGGIYAYHRFQSEMAINKNPALNRAVRDKIGGALVTELTDVVNEQAKERDLNPDLINAVIRHESGAAERRLFGNGKTADTAEAGEAILRSLTDNKASIGIGQMQTDLALKLGELGYAPKADSVLEVTKNLLDPATAVKYIAGNLEYLSDNLLTKYGETFSNLPEDTQTRIILIGYNQGWENLQESIEEYGLYDVENHYDYDNLTYDDYLYWSGY